MKKYHKSTGEDGMEHFHLPLKPDPMDNMIGRECHNNSCVTKYFKIGMTFPDELVAKYPQISDAPIVCPYCGFGDYLNKFITEEQMEWFKSMMVHDIAKNFQDMLSKTFGQSRPSARGFISVTTEYKPGRLPGVRYYSEEKLKRKVTCDKCKCHYAVYGISFQCPFCHEGNLQLHLERSAQTLATLINEAAIWIDKNPAVGEQMLGNALEDVITLFESFLKHLYGYKVKNTKGSDAQEALKKIGNSFQRLDGAADSYRDDFKYELFADISKSERDALELQFMKRHIITHNLGMVDSKFLEKTGLQLREGAEVELDKDEVREALDTVVKTVSKAIGELFV